jgi:hypothetical protein
MIKRSKFATLNNARQNVRESGPCVDTYGVQQPGGRHVRSVRFAPPKDWRLLFTSTRTGTARRNWFCFHIRPTPSTNIRQSATHVP